MLNEKDMPKTVNGQTGAEVFRRLNEPFDIADIRWKPQTVDYKKKTAMAVAHADPRAYIDRLNEVLGTEGWATDIQFIVTPFNKFIKGRKAYGDSPATEDKLIPGNKVLATCTVSIHGLGHKTSTGDEDASDENAATSAEAQAFKRACMMWGLGRYLYDLPKQTVPYDPNGGGFSSVTPSLPDWAVPKILCVDCNQPIVATKWQDKEYSATAIINNSQKKYNTNVCLEDQRKRADKAKEAAGGRLNP